MTPSSVILYDAKQINDCIPPPTDLGKMIEFYWIPMMRTRTNKYIKNIDADLYILTIDDLILPISVTNFQPENSYTCSIYTHYISYSLAELVTLKNPVLEKILASLILGLGKILKMGDVDRAVYVNNWLLSTNLYPNLNLFQIQTITKFLIDRFPDRAIIWRSLNSCQDDGLLSRYRKVGYHLLGSRQIYWFDPANFDRLTSIQRWHIRRDLRLLEKYNYQIITDREELLLHSDRLTELYDLLYLKKYSYYNPQFTSNFIKSALNNPQFHFQAVSLDGTIEGILGFYQMNGVITTPILGYNTQLSPKLGLYRLLSGLIIQSALQGNLLLNESSGAADFKRYRGGIPAIEYSAIYTAHLSWYRRQIWQLLHQAIDKIAIPLIKKYEL